MMLKRYNQLLITHTHTQTVLRPSWILSGTTRVSQHRIRLTAQLLNEEEAQFVLTGCFQQDPLKESFAAHRQRAGCSYNPSALQFQQTEKKMAVLKSVTHNKNCNTATMEPGPNKAFWDNSILR